jgi:hypothetical protein
MNDRSAAKNRSENDEISIFLFSPAGIMMRENRISFDYAESSPERGTELEF